MLTPTERWMRPDVGATPEEAEYLADWYEQIGLSAPGAVLISSASYSDWDLQQQLEAWRTEGIFPTEAATEEAEAKPASKSRAKEPETTEA